MTSTSSDDSMLLNELRIKDESLTKEMYENPSDPDSVLNVLIKKLQLYNEIEFALSEARTISQKITTVVCLMIRVFAIES